MTETRPQRDARGRLLPGHTLSIGNKGGPGRPPRAKEEMLLQALRESVSYDDLCGMVQACVNRAKGGDVQALRAILPYLVGQPAQQIKLDAGRVILVAEGAGPFAPAEDAPEKVRSPGEPSTI